ncbi:SsgA family sporulation/cell division regulator [Streptomyces bambusae]|uniref:SsgA family sporulation/cell division regulator n=1 Tax=Streptomyces bambusae TaxID=1550616 RepID=UPI0035AC0A43
MSLRRRGSMDRLAAIDAHGAVPDRAGHAGRPGHDADDVVPPVPPGQDGGDAGRPGREADFVGLPDCCVVAMVGLPPCDADVGFETLLEDDLDFEALLDASSLGAPHVTAVLGLTPEPVRQRIAAAAAGPPTPAEPAPEPAYDELGEPVEEVQGVQEVDEIEETEEIEPVGPGEGRWPAPQGGPGERTAVVPAAASSTAASLPFAVDLELRFGQVLLVPYDPVQLALLWLRVAGEPPGEWAALGGRRLWGTRTDPPVVLEGWPPAPAGRLPALRRWWTWLTRTAELTPPPYRPALTWAGGERVLPGEPPDGIRRWRERDGEHELLRADVIACLYEDPADTFLCRLAVRLTYRPSDPYAVEAVFHSGEETVAWVFARELLAEGLRARAGAGDVTVWSDAVDDGDVCGGDSGDGGADGPRDGRRTFIELSPPEGTALVALPSGEVSEFLDESEQLVARGEEPEHLLRRLEELEAEFSQLTASPGSKD